MAFSGNWLKSQQRADPRATHLPTPSPAHGQDVGDPYPQENQAPPSPDYTGADFARTVVQTPGLDLDAPSRSHDSPAVGGVFRTQAERQAAQAAGHTGTQDRGWARATFVEPPFQDDTTRYLESTWTGNGATTVAPEAIQRGINSHPQNNPDVPGYDPGGFRRGQRTVRFVDRKHNITPRVYTAQQLLAREIRVPVEQPAQDGTGILRTSPFRSMARPLDTIAVRPGMFRQPPSLTETVLADAPEPAADGGIATDGMWTVV